METNLLHDFTVIGRWLALPCGLTALTLKRHLQVITVGSPSNQWNLSKSNHYAMYEPTEILQQMTFPEIELTH